MLLDEKCLIVTHSLHFMQFTSTTIKAIINFNLSQKMSAERMLQIKSAIVYSFQCADKKIQPHEMNRQIFEANKTNANQLFREEPQTPPIYLLCASNIFCHNQMERVFLFMASL